MNSLADHLSEKQIVRHFLRWCWPILLTGSLAALLLELSEEHEPGFSFWLEAVMNVVLAPTLTGLLLILLARNVARRAHSEDKLERYLGFIRQLGHCQEWDELTRFVVRFPGTLMQVDHARLFIYDHHKARLEFVIGWNPTSAWFVPTADGRFSSVCRACSMTQPFGMRCAEMCMPLTDSSDSSALEYCLPLSCRNVLVGVLRLRRRPDQTFTPDQIEFMNGVGPEIALALAVLIAQPRKMDKVRAEAQIHERRRLASELHESLAQQISYLCLSLNQLADDARLSEIDDVRQELERSRDAAKDAYKQIRSIVAIFRSWGTANFVQAIADHARMVARHSNLDIDFITHGQASSLPPSLRQSAFSLVRESLNNVERHAKARHVQIILRWSVDELILDMIDDGTGFDPSSLPEGHYGLEIMHDRIAELGGEMHIDSAPGRGTRLGFKIPLPRHRARDDDRSALQIDRHEMLQHGPASPAFSQEDVSFSVQP